jgi:hypothetical protein
MAANRFREEVIGWAPSMRRGGLEILCRIAESALHAGGVKMFRSVCLVLMLCLGLASCGGGGPSGGGSSGGIVIQPSDGSPPEATLQAGATVGGGSAAVSSSVGTDQSMILPKTGSLNLIASAQDFESGIKDLGIWIERSSTSCDPDECSNSGPLNSNKPEFSSTEPAKAPGENDAGSSIMAQSLDLTKEIRVGHLSSGQSVTVTFKLYVKAVNHLGKEVRTPSIVATYHEAG